MARNREPIDLIIAKGNKHLTKAEIESRSNSEVKPITEGLEIPGILTTKKQKEEFNKISNQLMDLHIFGVTDADTLARYIVSRELYERLTKQLKRREVMKDPVLTDKYMRNQSRAFRQVRECATDLGLTITSRCKLVVPEIKSAPVRKNKYDKFDKKRVNG